MKTNIKALQLIEKGLSSNTVSKLNESQINVLHKKMFTEQATNPKVAEKVKNIDILNQKLSDVETKMKKLGLEEDDDFDLDADQAYTGQQGSHDADQPADDGMDDDTSPQNHDSKMIGMSEEKDGEPNPYSICHAQVGPKKSRKFERCVMSVKKQLKEGKNPVSLFLETQIEKIVEKHIPPRITKSDLLKIVKESTKGSEPSKPGIAPTYPKPGPTKKQDTKEQATAPAPAKPATEPTTRPSTTPKEKPFSPGKNPAPAVKPAPKAGKISPETAKEKVIDIIMNILEK